MVEDDMGDVHVIKLEKKEAKAACTKHIGLALEDIGGLALNLHETTHPVNYFIQWCMQAVREGTTKQLVQDLLSYHIDEPKEPFIVLQYLTMLYGEGDRKSVV